MSAAERGAESLAESTKRVMRRAAKSVWVVACCHEGKRIAMAATSVDAFSLDPPTMLVCVNRSASLHPALAAGAAFSLNLLGSGHQAVSQACGGRLSGEARFSVGIWDIDPVTGVPVLSDAQGSFICSKASSLRCGTHELFVGAVVDVRRSGPLSPLIYLNGQYVELPRSGRVEEEAFQERT